MWFAYVLTGLFLVTGFFWLLDRFFFMPQRKRTAAAIREQMKGGYDDAVATALARPIWLEYTAGLFGVVALVFVLRSFLYEPFRIPSGSMLPTLYVGDFILVNKYAYGIRMPISNDVVVSVGTPQRGDIMVFQYPVDKSQNYIKRVVGVPGDVVVYNNKMLSVNGQSYAQVKSAEAPVSVPDRVISRFVESGERTHDILTIANYPAINVDNPNLQRRANPNCTHAADGSSFECTVPAGQYFMMGDNRDDSEDSRYWGFVPDENIIGRASAVWLHWDDFPSLSGLSLGRAQSLSGK